MASWASFLNRFRRVKASEVQSVIIRLAQQTDFQLPRVTFERMTKEGFERNVTVYACVLEWARAVGGIPWVEVERSATGKGLASIRKRMSFPTAAKAFGKKQFKALRNAEVINSNMLKLMERPNPVQGGGSFFQALTAFTQLHGNGYVERAGPKNGTPRELYVLRPDRVRIIPATVTTGQTMVGSYRYGDDTVYRDFKPEMVLHRKLFAASDDWYGLPPLYVSARAVDSDNEAGIWNWRLLKNSGRPSGAFIAEGFLSPEQRGDLRRELRESFSGANNAGRPIILSGGVDFKQLAMTPAEMQWIESRRLSKLEICQSFSVPGEMIGDVTAKTYANYREARMAFYQERVLPFMDGLRDDLNGWLAPLFGDRVLLDYDKDQIEALQEDQTQLWDRIESSTTLTVNEKREILGYEELDGGDVLLVSTLVAPLEQVIAPPEPMYGGQRLLADEEGGQVVDEEAAGPGKPAGQQPAGKPAGQQPGGNQQPGGKGQVVDLQRLTDRSPVLAALVRQKLAS